MTSESLLVHAARITELQTFCRLVVVALQEAGFSFAQATDALKTAATADCQDCHTQIAGEDLLLLSQAEGSPDESAKVKRLRLGYCVHPGCESYFYRLQFQMHPGVLWSSVISEAARIKEAEAASQGRRGKSITRFLSVGDLKRVGVALLLLVLLLLARQWYVGGRIPFLREPEKFQVDPAPEHGSEQQPY